MKKYSSIIKIAFIFINPDILTIVNKLQFQFLSKIYNCNSIKHSKNNIHESVLVVEYKIVNVFVVVKLILFKKQLFVNRKCESD